MATRRRILIKDINKELVAELISKHYNVDRASMFDYQYREVFLDRMNYAFIVFDNYLESWTELDLDFNKSVEEHDNFLLQITRDFKTTVIFGYEQTTTGDTKFLVIEKGQIIRSIYQKAYYEPDRILMEYNFGEKLKYESDFKYPEIGQNIEGFKFLCFDDLQEMFGDYGYNGKPRTFFDEKFLHIEYLK